MTITTTQKLIKIGSSRGVTLPARELKALGISEGDAVRVTIEPIKPKKTLADEYDRFKAQYGETLKNLSER